MNKETTTNPGETPLTPSGTEAEVCADISRRQAHGLKKYGTTVADNPLPLREWFQHAYEETLDKAVYLKRAITEMDRYPGEAELREALREAEETIAQLKVDARERLEDQKRQYFEMREGKWAGFTTQDYMDSVSYPPTENMFSLAYQWQDKPVRHVFDLCAWVNLLQSEIEKLRVGTDNNSQTPTGDVES